ncbi:MAG: hypothetical protein IJF47_03190 [Candidatus Methanomethylophilaceae archaeon]|nr:hypothetical protein [Candidatus Methanomethylophilaceae archaeon]
MHCKSVSVRDVGFQLNEENILNELDGCNLYIGTEYIIFRNGGSLAVVKIKNSDNSKLFSKVESAEIISLPKDTVYIEDNNLDVLNMPAMASLQSKYPGKTVVVKGMFSHINFIRELNSVKLRIIDNVPPSPSKLSVLVKMALDSGFIDYPIVTESIEMDMSDSINDVKTEAVMFPCEVSGLKADIPVYFLDKAPVLEHKVTLVGCHLSENIFRSLYGFDADFVNICPADFVTEDGVKTIVKCCKIKNGHRKDGNVVSVPWGATVPEIVEAINHLFSDE